ncbi:formylglycine-generating enzyme family protein [Nitrosomonas sp.]|uniref:formylglycine-generating enzyme family protein n=1 Tax=Nitrosomonas sp. TaxID=42353 RepID=UPI00260138BC|nr:formylglycine-generating enzyme family protein [Nitrosomonas sp.]
MVWGRLVLIHAAGENDEALQKMAQVLGYETKPLQISSFQHEANYHGSDNTHKHESSLPINTANEPAPRPSARFLRVNKREQLTQSNDLNTNQPHYLHDPTYRLTAQSAPKGTFQFAPPRPLFAMSRLLPFLHNGLGQPQKTGKIDYLRLTRWVANAKPIRRLPNLSRNRWPQRLQIIVDTRAALEPYWSDFADIIVQLKKLLGTEAVTSLRFDEDTLGKIPAQAIAWPTQENDDWFTWRVPAADVAILILSDLGISDSYPEARIRWQQMFRHLHTHSAPILTLSPADQSPQNLSLCRLINPNPLNDTYRVPRHPNRRGFRLPQPTAEQFEDILTLLSPLPLIDRGLLRRLRDQLKWGSSELESQIWNHPDVHRTSLGIRVHDSVIKKYHRRYQQKFTRTPESAQLWQCVQEHHKEAFEGLHRLEALNHCVMEVSDQTNDVRHYFQRLCATTTQETTQKTALLMQCQTILNCLPTDVWRSSMNDLAYDLYAMGHQEDIRAGRWPDHLEPGFDPSRLLWVLDEQKHNERVQWQVKQIGSRGELICQQRTQNTEVVPPVVQFDAHPAFPPTYRFSSPADQNPSMIRTGQTFNLNNDIITIQTAWQRLELEAIDKPDWATDIWCNAEGLSVRLPVWRDVAHTAKWFTGEAGRAGSWLIPLPFGIDQYGLYADLFISPQITELSSAEELITQRFRWITPGTFLMGSPESEPKREDNETQHEVTLTQGYWLADSACTQALWTAVMAENPSRFQDDPNHPVENVSWLDVQPFIEKLNTQFPDLHARLPTEAQWEYACRAGTQTPFSFGENITPEQVNYNGERPYAGGEKGLYREKTVPVKSLPSNPWGLYEMHGNVWEWCIDWHSNYPRHVVTNPPGAEQGTARILRGGSWNSYGGRYVRSASRSWLVPDYRGVGNGFRLVLS